MPHAVTHVLIVIILLELFRHYFVKNKKTFPLHYVLIGGIAGLIPDLDVAISYFFNLNYIQIHRIFLHNLFVPLIFVLLAFLSYGFKSKKLAHRHLKLRNIFLVIAFGCFVHLALDIVVAGTIMPFFPFSNLSVGLDLVKYTPITWQDSLIPSIDALILVLWLISLELRHKISSFI